MQHVCSQSQQLMSIRDTFIHYYIAEAAVELSPCMWSGLGLLNLRRCAPAFCRDLPLLCSYFLYTPLLPACATGNVEERSIVEPVRRVLNNKVRCWHQQHPHVVAPCWHWHGPGVQTASSSVLA